MPNSRTSGGSEDFGNSGLPKKLKTIGFPPNDFSKNDNKKNRVFKKTRIYQLGSDVPSDEILVDERSNKTNGG